MVTDSNKGLAVHDDLPMFPYRFVLGTPGLPRGRVKSSLRYLYRLYDTTYRDRRRAFDLPNATSLETSDA